MQLDCTDFTAMRGSVLSRPAPGRQGQRLMRYDAMPKDGAAGAARLENKVMHPRDAEFAPYHGQSWAPNWDKAATSTDSPFRSTSSRSGVRAQGVGACPRAAMSGCVCPAVLGRTSAVFEQVRVPWMVMGERQARLPGPRWRSDHQRDHLVGLQPVPRLPPATACAAGSTRTQFSPVICPALSLRRARHGILDERCVNSPRDRADAPGESESAAMP